MENTLENGLKVLVNDNYAVVLGYTDPSIKELVIPETIDVDGKKIPIIKIAPKAFFENAVEKLTLTSKLQSIGESAFGNCAKLSHIEFLDSEEDYKKRLLSMEMGFNYPWLTIGKYAFQRCSSLTELVFPIYVEEIGDHAFEQCTSLQKVVWKELDRNEKIFSECNGEYPRKTVSIGDRAFFMCEQLTELELSPLTRDIGDTAFSYTGLKEFKANFIINNWGSGVFSGCEQLETVAFPSNLGVIPSYTCDFCTALKEIIWPVRLSAIRDLAFGECTSLTKITIPRQVTSIDSRAFLNCNNIHTVHCLKKQIPLLEKQLPKNVLYC